MIRITIWFVWVLWSHICGVGVVIVAFSYGVARLSASDLPVSVHVVVDVESLRIPVGGDLRYRFTVHRLRNCKGYVSDTYTAQNKDDGFNVSVARWRPITNSEPGVFRRDLVVPSPPSIKGQARYRSELVSQCPNGVRRDLIAEFDYEAVPCRSGR